MDVIASAVVLPDDPDPSPPSASSPAGTKRRQSSLSEQDAKRARISESNFTQRRDSVSKASASARAPKDRERGRERRLFGAALGALSQNPATAGQKRRFEIEKRQQAERKQEDQESELRRRERLTRRKAQRWGKQAEFDGAAMRLRHDNLLAMAHFLKTKAEPQLLYKPWETTAEENDRIRNQIAEARKTIEEEVEQYKRQKAAELSQTVSREEEKDQMDQRKQISHSGKQTTVEGKATANGSPTNGGASSPLHAKHQNGVRDSHSCIIVSETSADADNRQSKVTSPPSLTDGNHREAVEETGEEVVEATEDTVIY